MDANRLPLRIAPSPGSFMHAPPATDDLETTIRFLHRFADLMSAGSNAENLLLAATLLDMNAKRANEAEDQLRQERSTRVRLEAQLAALFRDDHVQVPNSIIRLAASQFKSMARTFEKSGDIVSRAMCEASAATLGRMLAPDASIPVTATLAASSLKLSN